MEPTTLFLIIGSLATLLIGSIQSIVMKKLDVIPGGYYMLLMPVVYTIIFLGSAFASMAIG